MSDGIELIRNDPKEIWLNDDVRLSYTVTDRSGASVDLSGASAVFSVSDTFKSKLIFALASTNSPTEISISGSTVTVIFNASRFIKSGVYLSQLRITKNGKTMVSAEGDIKVNPLIA